MDKVHYKCNFCNEIFNLKKELIKHINHYHTNHRKVPTNIICKFENCGIKLKTIKLLISHLQIDHNQNITVELK